MRWTEEKEYRLRNGGSAVLARTDGPFGENFAMFIRNTGVGMRHMSFTTNEDGVCTYASGYESNSVALRAFDVITDDELPGVPHRCLRWQVGCQYKMRDGRIATVSANSTRLIVDVPLDATKYTSMPFTDDGRATQDGSSVFDLMEAEFVFTRRLSSGETETLAWVDAWSCVPATNNDPYAWEAMQQPPSTLPNVGQRVVTYEETLQPQSEVKLTSTPMFDNINDTTLTSASEINPLYAGDEIKPLNLKKTMALSEFDRPARAQKLLQEIEQNWAKVLPQIDEADRAIIHSLGVVGIQYVSDCLYIEKLHARLNLEK